MSQTPLPMALGKRASDVDVLAGNSVLGRLAIDELSKLLDAFDQVALPADTVVAREADEGDYMYFVLEGKVRATRAGLELGELGPGEHFGELALVGVRKRAQTVTSIETVRLARFSRASFDSVARLHPRTAFHFLQALIEDLSNELTKLAESVGVLLRERSLPRRTEIEVTLGEERRTIRTVPMGTELGSLLPADVNGVPVVAALSDRKLVSLATRLSSDARVDSVTLHSPEGREIYRRSMGLVLLEAAHRIEPHRAIRMGPSLSMAQVVCLPAELDREDVAARLTRAMRHILAEGPLFREEVWAVDEARAHFDEQGWSDAALALRARRSSTVTLASVGEVYALREGPFLPSTRILGDFRLLPHPLGLLLDLRVLEPYFEYAPGYEPLSEEQALPRFGGIMAEERERWLGALGVSSVGSFNEYCVAGKVGQLIRVQEGFHEKRIGIIADAIAARSPRVRVIGIAGPSSSGKTTFIKRLTVQLEVNGLHPVNLSTDDYYVDRERTLRDEFGEYDFEALAAVDTELFQSNVRRLLAGDRIHTPRFDFLAGKSDREGGHALQLEDGDVLLVEGIHGLNPALYGDAVPLEALYSVFIHPAAALPIDRLSVVSPADIRLLRRIVRDRHSRGYKAEENLARWASVRRGERKHIYPYLKNAHAVFDSSLAFEISVLKVFAERYLLEVKPEHPMFPTAHRLRRLLDMFVAIYPDHVPPTSILREFIGGSGFEY